MQLPDSFTPHIAFPKNLPLGVEECSVKPNPSLVVYSCSLQCPCQPSIKILANRRISTTPGVYPTNLRLLVHNYPLKILPLPYQNE